MNTALRQSLEGENKVRTGLRKRNISVFDIVNVLIMLFITITILYPFLYVLKQSFLDPMVSSTTSLNLIPDSFTLKSYNRVLTNQWIGFGFINTITRVIACYPVDACSDAACSLSAFQEVLSKPHLLDRHFDFYHVF